jgi:hypothetical protein
LAIVQSRWLIALYDETIFSCAPLFSSKPKDADEFKIRGAELSPLAA